MNEPLISIVIPAYNLENYIAKTLDSVFSQTYSNIEVIVVNDGSKDKTAEILDRYAEKESRLIVFHKENGGVTSARIKGIEMSSGDYIGFVDGDDLIDADMYERLLKNAIENDADISHCGYRMIDDGSVKFFYNTGKFVVQDNKQGLCDLLSGEFIEPGLCNKLYNKRLFDNEVTESEFFNNKFKENEDLLMNYSLFKKAQKSIYEDFCPYQYVIRKTSASHGRINRNILTDPIKIGEMLIEDTKNDSNLNLLASRYYVVKLIKATTMSYKRCPKLYDVQKLANKKLRKFIRLYIDLNGEVKSKKILAVFATYMPNAYRLVHKIYLSRR